MGAFIASIDTTPDVTGPRQTSIRSRHGTSGHIAGSKIDRTGIL
jgi:hypothetical protein